MAPLWCQAGHLADSKTCFLVRSKPGGTCVTIGGAHLPLVLTERYPNGEFTKRLVGSKSLLLAGGEDVPLAQLKNIRLYYEEHRHGPPLMLAHRHACGVQAGIRNCAVSQITATLSSTMLVVTGHRRHQLR
jgi:hypothetical protein